MAASANSTPLKQELVAAHALALECAARAGRFLDGVTVPGSNERTNLEAVRIAGLATRLMEGVGQVVPRLRGRLAAGAPTTVRGDADKGQPAAPAASSVPKLHAAHGQRRGRLKNGNPSGDYLKSPRCGARTRADCGCRQPAMANGRCRLHGGLSTGPRTPEGLARCRTTRLTHGYRSRDLIGLRRRAAHAARRLRGLARVLSAGHGVHRSDSTKRTRAMTQSNQVVATSASSRLRAGSSTANRTIPAGHGVHRSFRDHLRSSASGCGCQTIHGAPAPSAGHGLHRSDRADQRPLT